MQNDISNKIVQLNHEYEDHLFRLVMNDLAEKEGTTFIKGNEQSRNNHLPSPENLKRFTKLLDYQLKKEKQLQKFRHPKRILYRISATMLIMTVIFSTMMVTVKAFRIEVLNFLISIEPQYTSFQLNDNGENQSDSKLILTWANTYIPTYIPDGYVANNISYSDSVRKIIFTNQADDSSLIYTEYEAINSIAVDTEDASIVESIKINNHNGTLTVKNSTAALVWQMDNHLFIIKGELNKNELIKMAEGVKFKK